MAKSIERGAGRPAFTLIEMLAVIGVIGILVALLLPAIQSTRELARRSGCANNLTQLMSACAQYESAHAVYPPGVVTGVRPVRNSAKGYHHSWLVQILPFCEQTTLWRSVDKSVSVYHPNNDAISQLNLPLHRCPSDLGAFPGPLGTSYAGVHHDVEAPIDIDNHGVFFANSRLRRIDVDDGLSHTIFIGEKVTDAVDFGWMSGTRSTLRNTGSPLNVVGKRGKAGAGLGAEVELQDHQPEEEIIDAFGFGDAIPKKPPSDYELDDFDVTGRIGMSAGGGFAVGGFSCHHTGVVQFAFGDGAVRRVAESVDRITLQRMAHRANGDVRQDDW
jgi:prepilin-type N-terminal cleavage/methylation domain-containing protein